MEGMTEYSPVPPVHMEEVNTVFVRLWKEYTVKSGGRGLELESLILVAEK